MRDELLAEVDRILRVLGIEPTDEARLAMLVAVAEVRASVTSNAVT